MKTYEMVAIADKNKKTYITGSMRYNFRLGFHDENGDDWDAKAWSGKGGLSDFIHNDEWKEVIKTKMTLREIEKELGYEIEIYPSL